MLFRSAINRARETHQDRERERVEGKARGGQGLLGALFIAAEEEEREINRWGARAKHWAGRPGGGVRKKEGGTGVRAAEGT